MQQNLATSKISAMEEYFPVPHSLFKVGKPLDYDIYLRHQGNFIIFNSKNKYWTPEDLQKLKESKIQEVFLRLEPGITPAEFIDQRLALIINDPHTSIPDKAQAIYQTTVQEVAEVMKDPSAPEKVKRSLSMVKHCVNFLGKDRTCLYELFKFSTAQYAEQTHAIQVAAYALALGKHLGYRNPEDQIPLGLGALLHDVGKTKVDSRILNKNGGLNDIEREEVNKHPLLGYEILKAHSFIPELSRLIVLQHHERNSAFPGGPELHIFSKIVGISDCFDTLTSTTSWRVAMTPMDACRHMISTQRYEFDTSILMNFIRILQS